MEVGDCIRTDRHIGLVLPPRDVQRSVYDALVHHDRFTRHGRHSGSEIRHAIFEPVGVDHLQNEPDLLGLVGADQLARESQELCPLRTDKKGQGLCTGRTESGLDETERGIPMLLQCSYFCDLYD